MNLRQHLGSLRRRALCSLYRRTVQLGNAGPIVSFTFDDFPRSAYSAGGSILERFGARGTYYATGGLMRVSNELGELFVADDLDALVARGHELGTQTFHHSSCRSVSLAAFVDDVRKGMRAVEQVKGHNAANFAYPYGHVTLGSKKILGPVLTSSRSIFPGFNGPEIDLNLLRANKLYGDMDQSQRVEDLILQNVKQDILVTEGEQDHLFNTGWMHRVIRELVCARSVTARVFTAREGAEQHCQLGNTAVARDEIVFWLSRFYPGMQPVRSADPAPALAVSKAA